jgi:hypothetical protein
VADHYDYPSFVLDVFRATGFDSRLHSEAEMRLCLRGRDGDGLALRKSYCKRLEAFAPFQDNQTQARSANTIGLLLAQQG